MNALALQEWKAELRRASIERSIMRVQKLIRHHREAREAKMAQMAVLIEVAQRRLVNP